MKQQELGLNLSTRRTRRLRRNKPPKAWEGATAVAAQKASEWNCWPQTGLVPNLAPDKGAVFREAARLLRAGRRLTLADIVTDVHFPEGIPCAPLTRSA